MGEEFRLRTLCEKCTYGNIREQIFHRINSHGAEYYEPQMVIRYRDHFLDIIPPSLLREDDAKGSISKSRKLA